MKNKDISIAESLYLAFLCALVLLFFYICFICIVFGVKHPRANVSDYLEYLHNRFIPIEILKLKEKDRWQGGIYMLSEMENLTM